jgi:hypothetical protein
MQSMKGANDMTSPDDYGLPSAARAQLADSVAFTVKAVDKIGEAAAAEIEEAADTFEAEAREIAEGLRKFASAMREHSRLAAESVQGFCGRSTDVIATIRTLRERLDNLPAGKQGNGDAR